MKKVIQITAGKGPAECCWVVARVLKQFLNEVREEGLTYEIVHRQEGPENGTLQSAVLVIRGNSGELLSHWAGTIQWTGNSMYRKYHKRKNWFIGLFELENVKPNKVHENDIAYQAIRSSGPGGQHVNKVSSAVRATHIGTGISVLASENRSQHQNKKRARERVLFKIEQHYWEAIKKRKSHEWENHVHLQRGNPVKVFRGTDFKKEKKTKSFKANRQALKQDLKNELWKR